ncbi:MAG: hypothetical protein WCR05_09885 [Sphaerochaetaceae bacterium]
MRRTNAILTFLMCLCGIAAPLPATSGAPATPTIDVRQDIIWNRNTTASTDWALATSAMYHDERLRIVVGIRRQAPSTDIGTIARITLGNPPPSAGRTLVLTIQGHGNILHGMGGNIDLAASLGQDFRTSDIKNWWGLSYSLGIQGACSFSPYVDHPLFGVTPTLLLNATKAIQNRFFIELTCTTNSLFLYTSQLTLMLGADIACRISNQLLIGLSSLTRFSDTPTETGFITMHETSLYLTWMEVLP